MSAFIARAAVACTLQKINIDGIEILRPSFALGAGLVVARLGQDVAITVRAQAVAELVHVAGTEPLTGASGSGSRWMAGIDEGFEVAWSWSPSLGLVLGASVVEGAASTQIQAHGQTLVVLPSLDFGASGGLRFTVP